MAKLPQGYSTPANQGRYFKPTEGKEVRFRILSDIVVGYELWINKKPVRKHELNEFSLEDYNRADPNPFTGEPSRPRHFWAMVAYDYEDQKVKIFHTTQATVQRGMENFMNDSDWEDPSEYDFVVSKGKDSKEYQVKTKPKKELDSVISEDYKKMSINLEALYTGGDPFGERTTNMTEEDAASIDRELDEAFGNSLADPKS